VLYFLVATIRSSWSELVAYTFDPSYSLLAVAVVMVLTAYVIIWARWHLTLRYLGEPASFATSGAIYAFFQVSTYIPGGVWQYIQLNYLAEKTDIAKKTATAAMLQHQIFGILGAGTIFIVFGGAALFPFDTLFVTAVLIAGILMTAAYPPLLERCFNPVLQMIGRERLDLQIGWRRVLLLLVISTGSWLLTAAGFAVLLQAVTGTTIRPVLLAVFPAAWLSGFLLLLAPGGLGVRDAALITLLSRFVSESEAVIVAVVGRLWMILPEAVFGLFYLLVAARKNAVILSD
jgi:uncharacterized membrane protein YbhN (UPF0104 family)